MATKRKQVRRSFGAVRKLPSGRYQGSYLLEGQRVKAPRPFPTMADAEAWLSSVETDLTRGVLKAPPKTTPTLEDYSSTWVAQRRGLKASTRELYTGDVRRYLTPYLGHYELSGITPGLVRDWEASVRADLAEAQAEREHYSQATRQTGEASAARAYRTLRAILNTAVEDGLILANPCKLKGAGIAPSGERPTLSPAEVLALAAEVPGHYRAVVLLAAFVGLRIGEIAALRPRDLTLSKRASVSVTRRAYRMDSGEIDYDSPKSDKGSRVVALPPQIAGELRAHLQAYRPGIGADDLVFVTETGRNIRGGGYSQALPKALRAIGRPDARVHDLRHTGATQAAQAGASLPELMHRHGHSTAAAAQLYLHATDEHGREVAEGIGEAIASAVKAQAKKERKAAKKAAKSTEAVGTVVSLDAHRGRTA